ncbi:hypothetical protein Q3A66_19450 [Hymenobacter sp. BT770]|uniref:hypothetical protein n=1 Tax=Hymenobacter sp. BT770 TaxID=2886942 RepID=UPI001D1248C9|nr:hypothetical protein [Hymenobacter sp. BT770]MCC3155285.1 hypothetical protein [Hymenobacter sp. BT770]MDO3417250.1 hypothetical protein [Hymenobacter sp. BT770]
MRSAIAVVLGFLMLLGSFVPENDLGELAKLPQLLEHYQFHHSPAGGGLTFSQFIVEHYGAGTKHYAGCSLSPRHQQDHHNLPLRCHHGCGAVGFVVAAATRMAFEACSELALAPAYRAAPAARYACCFSSSVAQPPRA